jgi:hypothetical protein
MTLDLEGTGQAYGPPNQQIAEVDDRKILPPFSKIDIALPDGVSETTFRDFQDSYRKYCQVKQVPYCRQFRTELVRQRTISMEKVTKEGERTK